MNNICQKKIEMMDALEDSNKSWDIIDNDLIEYNNRQYKQMYRSTNFVISCLKELGLHKQDHNVLDVGCGGGANLSYIANRFDNCSFTGIDINEHFINMARDKHKEICVNNTSFKKMDFIDLKPSSYDIVGSSQFLEVLDMKKANKFKHKCFQTATKGVYFQAFFTKRLLDYEINIHDYLYNKIVPYNIFSIEKIKEIAAAYNFELSYQKEFIIDCDLPDIHEGRGSYTVKKENLERMMFTDVLHLPWYFLYFSKKV